MNEDKRIVKIAIEGSEDFDLQLSDIRKMLSDEYKNDFFQLLWLEDNQDLCIKETF